MNIIKNSIVNALYLKIWIWPAIILISFVFISPDSFWIDEGNAAYKATQPTFSQWFHALTSITGSDSQMPGYMFYIWAWEKFSGVSEFALRLSNLPWLILLVWSLRRSPWAIAVALTSPFILNYLNEFRPYLMQIAGSAVVYNGISRLNENPRTAWITFLTGCLIMSASSLLGVIWSLGALIYVAIESPRIFKHRWFWYANLVVFPAFGALGVYYAWTLTKDQGAAPMGGGVILSLGAVGYELLGLAGLGPAKIELRTNPKALLDYALILVPAALVTSGVIIWSLSQWLANAPRRQVVAAVCGISVPVLILLTLLFFKDFRVLGRHLAPLSVLLVLLIGKSAESAFNRLSTSHTKSAARTAALLVIALGIISSLSLRFAHRHRKDDYRTATAIALAAAAENKPVLWAADKWTAHFYGLNEALSGWRLLSDHLPPLITLDEEEIVILTKPDIFDPKGELRALLFERGFTPIRQLPAFTIYERTDQSNPCLK